MASADRAFRLKAWFFGRYAITGVTVAGAYVCLYFLFREPLALDPSPASALAMVFALCLQYIMHSVFTFRRRWADANQAIRFFVSILIGLAASEILVARLGAALGVPEFWRLVVVIVTLPVVNFLLFKFWVYALEPPEKTNTGPAP